MRTLRYLLVSSLFAFSMFSCSPEVPEDSGAASAGGPIIIVSIDTLRADRLPAWGYDGVETPVINSLVADGIRFDNAWSHVPLTLPSHTSIFTGLLPGEHGVRDNLGYQLRPDVPTLASRLQQNGYATAGMVSAWVLRGDSGISNGFQVWDDGLDPRPGAALGELQRSGDATVAKAVEWLNQRPTTEPFFLFVHLFEPHSPYSPPEPYRSRYPDRYDGEIATVDAIVGQLLSSLRSRGLYDDSTIILLSDHGEGLNDHGEEEHGIFLYREALHVPLVLKLPGSRWAGKTVDDVVQLIDVFPTVLEAAGIPSEGEGQGQSLIGIASGETRAGDRRVFSESMYPRLHFGWSELTSLTDGDIHVIQAPMPELYRMSKDPAESVNLVEQERRLYADYRDEIEKRAVPFVPPAPVSAEAAAKLTALGYLGSGPSSTTGPLPDPKERIHELQKMKEAWTAMFAGRQQEAVRLYEEVVESNPLLADAWIQLSMAYEKTGAIESAIRAAQRAIQISPSLSQGIAVTIARLQLEMGDLEGAEQHAELAKPVNPEEAELIFARVALTRGNLDRAVSFASPLMEKERFRSRAVVVIAQAIAKKGELQRAVDLLEKERQRLIAADLPLPSLMDFARGDALVRLGRIEEGIAAFRSEIERHPGDLTAYSQLAAVYVLGGRVEEAQRVIEQLVTNNPRPESYELAANTFARLGRNDLAAQWRDRGQRR